MKKNKTYLILVVALLLASILPVIETSPIAPDTLKFPNYQPRPSDGNEAPELSSPNDFSFEINTQGVIITWQVEDSTFGPIPTYEIFLDSNPTPIKQGAWIGGNSEISCDPLDGLSEGSHNIKIRVNDDVIGEEMESEDTVQILVVNSIPTIDIEIAPNTLHFIIEENTFTYESISYDHLISWTFSDPTVGSLDSPQYRIIADDQTISSGDWESINELSYTITENYFEEGTHNLTLWLSDGMDSSGISTNGTNQFELEIEVIDSFVPLIILKNDTVYEFNKTEISGNICWNVSDDTVSGSQTYSIFLNNIEVVQDSAWISNQLITIFLDELDCSESSTSYYVNRLTGAKFTGEISSTLSNLKFDRIDVFEVILEARDGLGYANISKVTLNIVNDVPIIASPGNLTIQGDGENHYFVWYTKDEINLGQMTYALYLNDEIVQEGSIESDDYILYRSGKLKEGKNIFELIIFDGLGARMSNIIEIDVKVNREYLDLSTISTYFWVTVGSISVVAFLIYLLRKKKETYKLREGEVDLFG